MNSLILWLSPDVDYSGLNEVVRSVAPYEGERLYLRTDDIESDYSDAERAAISQVDDSLRAWLIDYSGGIRTCMETAIRVAVKWECVVHTDFGAPMTGGAFIRRVIESSNWDWRRDPVDHDWTVVQS